MSSDRRAPAGSQPAPGCATTDSCYDTGTVNAIEGCDDPALDSAGTDATPDGIASFTEQNILPPATEAYTQTATTLVLTPGFEKPSGTSTVFTKFP